MNLTYKHLADHGNDGDDIIKRYPWEGSDRDYLYDEVNLSPFIAFLYLDDALWLLERVTYIFADWSCICAAS